MATPGAINPVFANARPTVSAKTTASFRTVTVDGNTTFAPGKGILNGTKSRDPNNTGFTTTLRPGLLLAKNSSTLKYAPWAIGSTTGALTGAGTSVTVAAAEATELVRRVGATGTLTLTGPPAASGTVRQMTATYSAVNTTTGAITITALGTNQVERIRFNVASTGGNLQLNVSLADGTRATTANIAWSATDATYLASINSALDTTTGVVGGIVATAISATDTDLGFTLTYSGTGFAGKTFVPAEVIVLPTSSTEAMYEPVTVAVNGAFVAGSVVSETTEATPTTYISESMGVMTDGVNDLDIRIPISAIINYTQLLPAPSDASLKLWVKQSLSSLVGGKFAFDDNL